VRLRRIDPRRDKDAKARLQLVKVGRHRLGVLDELFANRTRIGPATKRRDPANFLRRSERRQHQTLFRSEAVKQGRVTYTQLTRDVGGGNSRTTRKETASCLSHDLLVGYFFRSTHDINLALDSLLAAVYFFPERN
jgi:hypothetical protein